MAILLPGLLCAAAVVYMLSEAYLPLLCGTRHLHICSAISMTSRTSCSPQLDRRSISARWETSIIWFSLFRGLGLMPALGPGCATGSKRLVMHRTRRPFNSSTYAKPKETPGTHTDVYTFLVLLASPYRLVGTRRTQYFFSCIPRRTGNNQVGRSPSQSLWWSGCLIKRSKPWDAVSTHSAEVGRVERRRKERTG